MKIASILILTLSLNGLAFAQEAKNTKPAKEVKPEKKAEPKKIYKAVSSGAVFPVKPGEADLKPKLDTVTIKAVLTKFGGSRPEMGVSEVTVEIVDEPESGPMQATFELKPKSGIKPMVTTMTFLPKRHHANGWPRNKTAHFTIEELLSDTAPPNFVAAVLIECLLTGIEIPDNVILFGGMNAAGNISRKADIKRSDAAYGSVIRLVAEAAMPAVEKKESADEERGRRSAFGSKKEVPMVEKTMYLITGQVPTGTLDNFILDEDLSILNNTQVLRCSTFDEAMVFIRAIAGGSESELGKSLAGLSEAQKVLRERSIRMLANEDVWARVAAAGRASKDNVTAFAYSRVRTRKVAPTYSLDWCLNVIEEQVDKVIKQQSALQKFNDREMRTYMRDVAKAIEVLEKKVHPDATTLYHAAEKYMDAAEDNIKAGRKAGTEGEVPERVTDKFKAAAATYTELRKAVQEKLK